MDIGLDITSINRFVNKSDHFVQRILSKEEMVLFSKLKDDEKPLFLARAWATKEAIFKVTQDKDYLSYSLLHLENGKPYIKDHPELKVSISHEGDILEAIVLLDN